MELSSRSKPYIIPEYSLTGDLLSFLTCNRQYRYQNKGALPPSTPIQLWFGEFIHGVMEEAYLKWDMEHPQFPWNWLKDIRPIEEMIDMRLKARGLYPPKKIYCARYDEYTNAIPEGNDHPYQKIASARTEQAINIWGPDLFPLINSAEVLIKGIREMPNYDKDISRSNYYGINGVIDVISSLNIDSVNENQSNEVNFNDKNNTNESNKSAFGTNRNNDILNYLNKNEKFKDIVKTVDCDEYEIIIDYKGMKRPSNKSPNWNYHRWQLLTYAWLRSKQEEAKPIVGGIIFYLNELVPSTEDLIAIKNDIIKDETDVKLSKSDEIALRNWDEKDNTYVNLEESSKKDRSIRVIAIENNNIDTALNKFDEVVSDIEKSTINEMNGIAIKEAWQGKGDKRTCDACDFSTFCEKNQNKIMKIP